MPIVSVETDSNDKGMNSEEKIEDYMNRVFKQAHQGVQQLKRSAQSVSFTNVLNQSTDAYSNMNKGKVDVSTSFIRDECSEAMEDVNEENVSFDS